MALRAAILAFALCAVLALAGCGLAGDRVHSHLKRADELLAENRGVEAILELRSAAQLAPDDPAITLRVAETSVAYGFEGDAVDFYRDYLAMVPDDDERAIVLAQLLAYEWPEEAANLLTGVLERDPANADAWLGRANLALARDDTREAMRHITKARQLDPDNAEVYWMLARAHEARIRAVRQRTGPRLQSPRMYQDALDAYEEYWKKGGDRALLALLGRANLLSMLPHREKEARGAYAMAVRATHTHGTQSERVRVLSMASRYARHHGFIRLETAALDRWLEIDPGSLPAWEARATVQAKDPAVLAGRIYGRMLEALPNNPGAHVLYAHYLADQQGFGAGLRHLRDHLDRGMDDAVILTGIISLQSAFGRQADAALTLQELRERFPGRQETELLAARQAINERRWADAIATLEKANADHESSDGQRLMARAYLGIGRYEDALVAIDRAMELERRRSPEHLRIRARILSASGQHSEAAMTLRRISRTEVPTETDRLMLARAYYDSHAGGVGRQILTDLLESESPSKEATLEFARRERVQPAMRMHARKYLIQALERDPDDLDLVNALIEIDLLDGRIDPVIHRLSVAIGHNPKSAELYLLRARVMLAIGRLKEARDDAERALVVGPDSREEALEVLSLVFVKSSQPRAGIQAMKEADAAGKLSPDRLVLLGRLQLQVGDTDDAIATYERALAGGSQLTMLKNDYAYLLARTGRDLDRALQLAKESAAAERDSLSAADTLGYVYLRAGNADAAFWQFRYVTANAEPPVAQYQYHLALALMELDRDAEARIALERALAIDPQFADAKSAREELARLSAAAAKPVESS